MGAGGYRRRFDPDGYRIIGFDQRGSGRSTPWACDSLETLQDNTTQVMIADIEALREHLGIEQWLVHGVSWGSTLALAYAISHPERCSAVQLYAVTAGARSEIDWITTGIGAVFPEASYRFADHVACAESGRPVEAYARLLGDPDPVVRTTAADEWDRWEATHISLGSTVPSSSTEPATEFLHDDPRVRLNFATLVTALLVAGLLSAGSFRHPGQRRTAGGDPGVAAARATGRQWSSCHRLGAASPLARQRVVHRGDRGPRRAAAIEAVRRGHQPLAHRTLSRRIAAHSDRLHPYSERSVGIAAVAAGLTLVGNHRPESGSVTGHGSASGRRVPHAAQPMSSRRGANWLSTISRIMSGLTRKYS